MGGSGHCNRSPTGHKRSIKISLTMTIALPNDLKHFITEHGLFEGFTCDDSPGGYVALWAVEDIPHENAGSKSTSMRPVS